MYLIKHLTLNWELNKQPILKTNILGNFKTVFHCLLLHLILFFQKSVAPPQDIFSKNKEVMFVIIAHI